MNLRRVAITDYTFPHLPLPSHPPLRDAPDLVLTPHAASYPRAALGRLQAPAAESIERALRGETPRPAVPGSQP